MDKKIEKQPFENAENNSMNVIDGGDPVAFDEETSPVNFDSDSIISSTDDTPPGSGDDPISFDDEVVTPAPAPVSPQAPVKPASQSVNTKDAVRREQTSIPAQNRQHQPEGKAKPTKRPAPDKTVKTAENPRKTPSSGTNAKCKPTSPSPAKKTERRTKNSKQELSALELAAFCQQMADILKAGIAPSEGITIMLDDSESEDERKILSKISDSLTTFGSFGVALEDAQVFPDYTLQMVRLGEQAGRLDEVMYSLARHYEREGSIAASVRSAVTYPFIMIGMMLLVVVVLITRVLPVFNQVFAQFGQEMTGVSRTLINIGNTINRYTVVFVIIIVVLILFILFLTKTVSGKKIMAKLLNKIRFTRDFYHKSAASRFASGMSLALRSGMTTEEGLEMSKRLTDNPQFLAKVNACEKMVEDGMPLSEALQKSKIFSGVYARMVTVASKTGKIDEVMQTIADRYSYEMDESITNAISILEPTLVAVLSIIVGLILLSVMMPLLGLLSGM